MVFETIQRAAKAMLIFIRGLAAVFDLAFVLSYLLCVSFAASTLGLASKDSPTMYALDFAFPLLYYGCLDSARFGAGTIGKRLFGLEIRLPGGRPIPLYLSLVRTVLKLALPVLAFTLAGSLVLIPGWGFMGIVALFAALLVFPVSLVFGNGAVGLHDRLVGTYVSRRGASEEPRGRDWRAYWLWTMLATAAVAFPASAFIRNLTGPKPLDLRSFANQSEPKAELAKELWLGKGSESIRPFVQQITIMPSIAEFPTDYGQSYSKLPQQIVDALRGNRGTALIIVYCSKQGYSQHNLRSAVIDRIAQVAAPKLIFMEDLPTFIWLAFAVESTFGPVILTQSEYGILIARKHGSDPRKIELTFAEPSEHRATGLSFRISGVTFSHVPF